MMLQRDPSQEATEFSHEEEEEEEESTWKKKKKKMIINNKRRFSEDQVKSLETIFASETKLEPKKKLQVAKQLGLQPRQVAIWFQNKRARWKSKQIEKNYRSLKANYDHLKARFESIRKEKDSLLDQVQELHGLLEKSLEGSNGCKDSVANSQRISRDSRDAITELPVKSSTSLQEEMDHQGVIYSEDDKSGNITYFGQDKHELMNITPIKWCSFDVGSLFDQSSTTSHWWDSWT